MYVLGGEVEWLTKASPGDATSAAVLLFLFHNHATKFSRSSYLRLLQVDTVLYEGVDSMALAYSDDANSAATVVAIRQSCKSCSWLLQVGSVHVKGSRQEG